MKEDPDDDKEIAWKKKKRYETSPASRFGKISFRPLVVRYNSALLSGYCRDNQNKVAFRKIFSFMRKCNLFMQIDN